MAQKITPALLQKWREEPCTEQDTQILEHALQVGDVVDYKGNSFKIAKITKELLYTELKTDAYQMIQSYGHELVYYWLGNGAVVHSVAYGDIALIKKKR